MKEMKCLFYIMMMIPATALGSPSVKQISALALNKMGNANLSVIQKLLPVVKTNVEFLMWKKLKSYVVK